MERGSISEALPIGATIPSFVLPNVDGEMVSERFFDGAAAGVVVFSCNHCPYVKGSDVAMIACAQEYQQRGVRFLAISSNDATQYPEDGFEKMKEKASSLGLPFPYLYDESQQVAKRFDAACTPELYVFDSQKRLAFHGTINNSPRFPEKVTEHHLRKALDQLLAGQAVVPNFVHPIGCSIKWRAV
jgi:peroxiredoxin